MARPPGVSQRIVHRHAKRVLRRAFKRFALRERIVEGGMMAAQSVVAASLAFEIGRAVHAQQAFWAAMTAIAVTRHGYEETGSLSKDQCLGAMTGAVFGLIGAACGGGFAAYAAAVAIVIIVCGCLGIFNAARLGAITVTIILLVPSHEPLWDVALLRLGQVMLGAVCALLVSWLASLIGRKRGTNRAASD